MVAPSLSLKNLYFNSMFSRLAINRLSPLVRNKSSLPQRALDALRGNVKPDEAENKKLFDQPPKKTKVKPVKASSPVNDTKLSDVPVPEMPIEEKVSSSCCVLCLVLAPTA